MSKTAKDKAELIGLIADVLRACPSSKDLYKGAAAAIENLRAENARLREALQHAEAAMEGMASDQLTAVETANLWNATVESIRTALEAKP